MFNFFKKDNKNIISDGFEALKNALSKTSKALIENVVDVASSSEEIDEFTLEDIEATLIKADLGVDLSVEIVDKIKTNNLKSCELKNFLRNEFENILENAGSNKLTGKKVLLAAGDTFRAAAEEQLDIWSKRAGVEIVRRDKADSASVVYEAIERAKKENFDIIIIDTAGRLQNKFNLIEELKKIKNVIEKNAPESLSECMLVLDANLGQNGLSQAKVFKEALNLTSVAITKLDGSAKGGIIIAIAKEFGLPAKLVGIGEKPEDLKNFDRNEFIEAIFN